MIKSLGSLTRDLSSSAVIKLSHPLVSRADAKVHAAQTTSAVNVATKRRQSECAIAITSPLYWADEHRSVDWLTPSEFMPAPAPGQLHSCPGTTAVDRLLFPAPPLSARVQVIFRISAAKLLELRAVAASLRCRGRGRGTSMIRSIRPGRGVMMTMRSLM